MERGLNAQRGFNKQAIVWLLLLVFCNLIVAECLHTHHNLHSPQIMRNSGKGSVVKSPHLSCKFCDYLQHHQPTLLSGNINFLTTPVIAIFETKIFPTQIAHVLNDLLLFSGNSPPIA